MPKTEFDEQNAPAVQFLDFLAADMASRPDALQPVSSALRARIDALCHGVEAEMDFHGAREMAF
jgi:hypothetical protein